MANDDPSGAARDPRDLTDEEIHQAAQQMPDDEWLHSDNPLLVEMHRRAYLEFGQSPEEAEANARDHAREDIEDHERDRAEKQLQQLINEVMMATPIEDIADVLRTMAVPHEQGSGEPHKPSEPRE